MPIAELLTSFDVEAARSRRRWVHFVLVALLVLAVSGTDVAISGWVPTGADSGNWLALAREAFGQESMSAAVAYPPVVPCMLGALLWFLDPITALVVLETVARVALIGAVYRCTVAIGIPYAVSAGLLVGFAGAQLEASAWGAFPQLIATGLAVLSAYYMARYVLSDRQRHLQLALVFAFFTGLTHLLLSVLLSGAAVILWAHSSWLVRAGTRTFTRAWLPVGVVVASMSYPVFHVLTSPRQVPVLNPQGVDLLGALTDTFREALPLWAFVGLVALVAIRHRSWPVAATYPVTVGISFLVSALAFFLVVGEPRALLAAQVGAVLAAVASMDRFMRRNGPFFARLQGQQRLIRGMATVLSIASVGGIIGGSVAALPDTADYYRVVDRGELRVLAELQDRKGSLVVASRSNNGIQVGWWVEGYAGVPTYSGVDVEFLAFRDERVQARIANSIFAGDLPDDQARALLDDIGADFLVVDRRGPDASFLDTPLAKSLPVLVDSETLVILHAR